MHSKGVLQNNMRFLPQSLLLSAVVMGATHGAWATVKSDLDALANATTGTVVLARDDLTTAGGTIQAATASIQTLLGTPTHNPTEAGSITGITTDLKNDIDSGQASITAALGTVGGVLDVDPTTGVVDTLKTQADNIATLTTSLKEIADGSTTFTTMQTELGYSSSGTIGARITAALAAINAKAGTGTITLPQGTAYTSLEDAIDDITVT